MTTTLPVYSYEFPPDAFVDVLQGYLYLVSNLDEGWSFAVIREPAAAKPHDWVLAQQAQAAGIEVLVLTDDYVSLLYQGYIAELSCGHDTRYRLSVDAVDELDDLLTWEDDEA